MHVILFEHIKSHKWDEFKKYLNSEKDIDINMMDYSNNYLIHYAVMFNKLDIVELLIKKGARIDTVDKKNRSLLYIPIKHNYGDMIKLLLKYNKIIIGESIIDISDVNGNTPLHYAIGFQNMEFIKLLIEEGSNVNKTDLSGFNSLHLSVYSRSLYICKIIYTLISNINARSNNGETCLHIAVNLGLFDIVSLFLQAGADPNISDLEFEVVPLTYSVNENNKEITELLARYKANPNIQDIYGNTPIHYAVMKNNFSMLTVNYQIPINFNKYNIDGKIPMHLCFDKRNNVDEYVNYFIEKSNLNVQDNNNMSCLHYLTKTGIWVNYMDLLKKKKLNIYLKNKDNKTPLDYADKRLIDVAIDSYIYLLENSTGWKEEWENNCSKDLVKCRRKVKKKIVNLKDECGEFSFPVKKSYVCIDVSEGENVKFCTYTGADIDILVGLIYLLKKYENICSILTSVDKFEIMWSHFKLHIQEDFDNNINKCMKNNKKRFIIIPLGIELNQGQHANYLIYDKKKNEIERFEPHGAGSPQNFYYNPNLLDTILEKRIGYIIKNAKYVRPSDYLPKIGFQLFDVYENVSKIGDPGGFCALWAMWYVDMRIKYKEVQRKDLVEFMIQIIKKKNISFKNLIRNYSVNVLSIRDKILTEAEIDINVWLNEQYTKEQYNLVMQTIKKYFQ